jgi:predicted Zn-dependent protease
MKKALLFLFLVASLARGQQTTGTLTDKTPLGQHAGGKAHISIPGVKGVLELEVGPTAWEARLRPDGKETQLVATNRADSLLITAFLQKVNFPASAEKCRAEWWPMTEKSTKLKREDLRKTEKDGIALVEYIVPEFRQAPIRQKTIHAYLGSRDLCAEVHLSKVQFVPEDKKIFDDVLSTVRLLPDESDVEGQGQDLKNQYLAEGSQLYLQHKYAAAAEHYQKALDIEKQHPTLSKTLFRVLVDNLGMSYGFTKKLSKAKETFEYGISQDAEYPLFYYLLACTYGEMGKMDESLEQLRLAYTYKANLIAGESFPDPLKDDSFRKFVKDTAFVDAVHQMQGH